jgi:hypothetical protein
MAKRVEFGLVYAYIIYFFGLIHSKRTGLLSVRLSVSSSVTSMLACLLGWSTAVNLNI